MIIGSTAEDGRKRHALVAWVAEASARLALLLGSASREEAAIGNGRERNVAHGSALADDALPDAVVALGRQVDRLVVVAIAPSEGADLARGSADAVPVAVGDASRVSAARDGSARVGVGVLVVGLAGGDNSSALSAGLEAREAVAVAGRADFNVRDWACVGEVAVDEGGSLIALSAASTFVRPVAEAAVDVGNRGRRSPVAEAVLEAPSVRRNG